MKNKKPADGGFLVLIVHLFAPDLLLVPSRISFKAACPRGKPQTLFELGFLVFDVLAHNRVEFQNFEFLRFGALVLGGGVEVASSRRRFELYFLSHDNSLYYPA